MGDRERLEELRARARLEELRSRASGGSPEQIAEPTALAPTPPTAAQAGLLAGGSEPAPAPADPTSRAYSLGAGAVAGNTYGLGDEAYGLGGAAVYGLAKGARAALSPVLGPIPEDAPSVGDVYRTLRGRARDEFGRAQASHPGFYLGGQIAGGALGPSRSVQGLTGAARIAALARTGAATGALSGFGYSEGDAGEALADTARGAAVGALVAPGLDSAARALAVPIRTTARGLENAAGFALSRVAGGIQRDVAPVGGAAAFARAGLEGRAAGLIRPFDFFPGAMDRQVARVADFAQRSTNDIVQAIDDAGARIAVAPLQQALQTAGANLSQFPSANRAALGRLNGFIRDLGRNADAAGTISARTLQTAKSTIDDFIQTWDPQARSTLAQELNRALYGAVREAQEQAVETSAGAGGRAAYEAAKRASSLAQRLEQFQDSYARRQANTLATVGGLHGALGGLAGGFGALASGNLLQAGALYAGTRFATSPRTAAIGLSGAARAAGLFPSYASSAANPLVSRSAAQAIIDALAEERRPAPLR
jgi:hypothetical protein